MRDFLHITGALADASRVRMLLALRDGELCVCQLTELCGLAPSTVSKHLAILHQARLVEARKEGRWMYYRLPDADAPVVIREALDWVVKALKTDPQAVSDRRSLQRIRREDPVDLCRRQSRK